MKYFKPILSTLVALTACLPAMAVTEKEMEEARTFTAKSYLRYVNNGSGYLDDVNAKTMAELGAKLKAKEKENLVAFNAVKVPTDYASWDKKRLVEYWAATFFTSPGLDPNGKGARTRVKNYIEAMNVTAPAPKEAETTAAAPEPAPTPASPAPETSTPEDGQIAPEDVTPVQDADILADQKEIEKAAEESRDTRPQEQSRTWVYVLVLAILVGIVIWLVIYAANLMKRQPEAEDTDSGKNESRSESENELREQTRKAIAVKNQELQQMRERLESAEARVASLSTQLESEKAERARLEESLRRFQESAPAPAAVATRTEIARPTPPAATPETPKEKPILKVIYLARANKRGIFVRGDRKITAGSTIYRLDTNDGLVGTFHVVDEPEVVDLALSDPVEYLSHGCTGEDLEDTSGVTRIVTKSAGTAIFENGYWKVIRKTRIQYE